MSEAHFTGDKALMKKAIDLLSWSLELGWDTEFGGLFSFLDAEGRQPAQIEWDMKYWWPHCEAIIATLMAYVLTKDRRWERWFETIHNIHSLISQIRSMENGSDTCIAMAP